MSEDDYRRQQNRDDDWDRDSKSQRDKRSDEMQDEERLVEAHGRAWDAFRKGETTEGIREISGPDTALTYAMLSSPSQSPAQVTPRSSDVPANYRAEVAHLADFIENVHRVPMELRLRGGDVRGHWVKMELVKEPQEFTAGRFRFPIEPKSVTIVGEFWAHDRIEQEWILSGSTPQLPHRVVGAVLELGRAASRSRSR